LQHWCEVIKAVADLFNLFPGGVVSHPFPLFLSFFPFFFRSALHNGLLNPAKASRGAPLATPVGENDICSYQTRSLGSEYTKYVYVA